MFFYCCCGRGLNSPTENFEFYDFRTGSRDDLPTPDFNPDLDPKLDDLGKGDLWGRFICFAYDFFS